MGRLSRSSEVSFATKNRWIVLKATVKKWKALQPHYIESSLIPR